MKVLFATTNLAKVRKYKEELKEKGIELITINDLDFKLDIDENGKNALENAYIKAKTYYDVVKIPTIGMDNCLFIEGLPEEKQSQPQGCVFSKNHLFQSSRLLG